MWCYKELKLATKPFTGRTLHGLLIYMPYISLRSLGMCRKQNFLTFTFHILSSPLFSLFLPHSFSLAGHLVGFILVRKVFGKAFRILGLDERKGRCMGSGTRFSRKFSGQCYMDFCLFLWRLHWIVFILLWFERSLHSPQVSGQSYPWQTKLIDLAHQG